MKKLLVLGITLTIILSGCTSRALTLTAAEGDLRVCAPSADPIPVETLERSEPAECRLSEVELLFPDGTSLTVDKYAGAGSLSTGATRTSDVHSYYDVGVYGLVAASATPHCERMQEWGSPKAKAKLVEAFGARWPCD